MIDYALAVHLKIKPILSQIRGRRHPRFQFSGLTRASRTASPLSQFSRVGLTHDESGLVHLAARRLLREGGCYTQRHADGQLQRAFATHFDARQKNTAISAVTPRLAFWAALFALTRSPSMTA